MRSSSRELIAAVTAVEHLSAFKITVVDARGIRLRVFRGESSGLPFPARPPPTPPSSAETLRGFTGFSILSLACLENRRRSSVTIFNRDGLKMSSAGGDADACVTLITLLAADGIVNRVSN